MEHSISDNSFEKTVTYTNDIYFITVTLESTCTTSDERGHGRDDVRNTAIKMAVHINYIATKEVSERRSEESHKRPSFCSHETIKETDNCPCVHARRIIYDVDKAERTVTTLGGAARTVNSRAVGLYLANGALVSYLETSKEMAPSDPHLTIFDKPKNAINGTVPRRRTR